MFASCAKMFVQEEEIGRTDVARSRFVVQKFAEVCSRSEFSDCVEARIVSEPLIPKLAWRRAYGGLRSLPL